MLYVSCFVFCFPFAAFPLFWNNSGHEQRKYPREQRDDDAQRLSVLFIFTFHQLSPTQHLDTTYPTLLSPPRPRTFLLIDHVDLSSSSLPATSRHPLMSSRGRVDRLTCPPCHPGEREREFSLRQARQAYLPTAFYLLSTTIVLFLSSRGLFFLFWHLCMLDYLFFFSPGPNDLSCLSLTSFQRFDSLAWESKGGATRSSLSSVSTHFCFSLLYTAPGSAALTLSLNTRSRRLEKRGRGRNKAGLGDERQKKNKNQRRRILFLKPFLNRQLHDMLS